MLAPPTPPIDFDGMVDKFVRLRDKIKQIKEKHTSELAPYNDAMDKLGALLLQHLIAVGAENVNTKHGTVHKCRKDSASIADMTAFWNWVIVNGDFDMVDRKANVPAVREYMERTGQPVPGVNFSTKIDVGVRRATKKS